MNRYSRSHQIEQLDPKTEHSQICRLLVGYEFPWGISRSLELAMVKTFCVPSISRLLDQTGEFHRHGQKRYDDTAILIGEILKHGYDSDKRNQALQRMNHIHGQYSISNEDLLYVLSTFVFEPIRWNNRFGWRKMLKNERLAIFYFWYEIGKRMNIQNIPDAYEDFERYYHDYEVQQFIYADTNANVAKSTINLFLSWFPAILHPILEPMAITIFDEKMISAFGFKSPSPILKGLVTNILKCRAYFQHLLPPRQTSDYFIDGKIRSYPQGYQIENIGPVSLLSKLNKTVSK